MKCPSCLQETDAKLERCRLCGAAWSVAKAAGRTGSVARSLAATAAAALAGAAVWWGLIAATGREFGLLALGVGWAVGWAAFKGGWQGRPTQSFGLAGSVLAVVLGKFLYFFWISGDVLKSVLERAGRLPPGFGSGPNFHFAAAHFWDFLAATTSSLDCLFLLAAAFEGWRVPWRLAARSLLAAGIKTPAGTAA